MLKKIAAVLLAPLLCIAIYHYAFAESIFTEECQARIFARQALKETYGLNQNLQGYFEELLVSSDDGYTFVYYSENDDLDYVLGRYTVKVSGENTAASWSWDGKEIPYAGYGLASNAWGKDQLMEIWLINKQTSNMQNYGLIARAIAVDAGMDGSGYASPLPEPAESGADDEYLAVEYDPSKATVSVEESRNTALKAIQEAYGISEERMANVRFDEDSVWFDSNMNGEPTMFLTCILWDNKEWQDGNGNYYIEVNQATGLVESISFIDGIIGNG